MEMPFGELTHVGPRNHVLDGGPVPPREGVCTCSAHAADECICRHKGRENGDAASCHITLDTCYCKHESVNIS